MVKFYCDKCGEEVKGGNEKVLCITKLNELAESKDFNFHLCGKCLEEVKRIIKSNSLNQKR